MIHTIYIFTVVFGAYILIHNELLLHNTKLSKKYPVIAWRCFIGGVMVAGGLAGILS